MKTKSRGGAGRFVIKMKGVPATGLKRHASPRENWSVCHLRAATVFKTRDEADAVLSPGNLGNLEHHFQVVKRAS